MRIAVLGAGLSGACAALELAEAGHEVDLCDRERVPLSQASYGNEGKIHLGLVYALDRSGRTARTMLEGALSFRPLLARWLGAEAIRKSTSDRFIYAVHRDSMASAASIRRHFEKVAGAFRSARPARGSGYIRPIRAPFF